jgi:hypothetical protein
MMKLTLRVLAGCTAAATLVACGGETDDDPLAPGGSAAAAADRYGEISLIENQFADGPFGNMTKVVFGWLDSGPTCGETRQTFGECTIVVFEEMPECDPPCPSEQICSYSADCSKVHCVAREQTVDLLDAGEISVTGAAHQPVVTCALQAATGSYSCNVDTSADWWDDDDTVNVAAAGNAFPGFELSLAAPAAISVTTTGLAAADFDGHADIVIEWESPMAADGAGIGVMHAGGQMQCLTADDGRFDIPADAIAAMGTASMWTVSVGHRNTTVSNAGVDGEITVSLGSGTTISAL